jgi:AAA family ATP:ADP antiporter
MLMRSLANLFSLLKNKQKTILLLALMLAISCLLNMNYAILRSARNALTVADLGGGAGAIPWYELCGTMPAAFLMTLILSWLLSRYSVQRVFFMTLAVFVLFFLSFSLVIYPLMPSIKWAMQSSPWIPFWASELLPQFLSMLFFVMAELWKIALLTVLFWGFVNQYISMENAKRYYAPLMFGGSIGTVLASPLITCCTSDLFSKQSWSYSLSLMMSALALISLLIAWMFFHLSRQFSEPEKKISPLPDPPPFSLWEGLKICCQSPYLMLLAWMTVADYIAYALGEVIFFDILKQKFPDPREYCDFMGKLSLWNGALTAICALFVTPLVLRRYRWVVASLATPVCLLVTEMAFFFALLNPAFIGKLDLLVLLGSLFFCCVRAAKYTLFDTSKELSFLLLSPQEKIQGKLVIDGMCARIGRGSASFVSLLLIRACGGVLKSAPIAGAIAFLISTSCVFATFRLGRLVEEKKDILSKK